MKVIVPAFGILFSLAAWSHADWPGFRGPGGQGTSPERGLPVTWGEKKNVIWKAKLPGPGTSSPIVWGDRVFLTCYTGYGLVKGKNGDQEKLKRNLLCIDRKTGDLRWTREVAPKLPEAKYSPYIAEHGYASSTPVTDGERVFVFFGRSGVLAFDFQGNPLWQADVGQSLNGWGSASSPVLYKNLVIINATVESSALIALDKESGKPVWRVNKIGDCWSTPVLVEVGDGKQELVLSAQGILLGIDPDKGARLWECDGPSSGAASSSPLARDGILYVMGAGFEAASVMALKAGGRGNVTKTHILWKQKGGATHTSPVLVGDRLYWISGQCSCLKAATGEIVFQKRLYDGGSEYVSPVAADGKIYAFTRRDGAFVLAAKDAFEPLAHNDLGDTSIFNASPANSHGRLLVRSNAFLYCLGENEKR